MTGVRLSSIVKRVQTYSFDGHMDHSRDSAYLDRLRRYFAQWRSLPSYNRLADVLGLASRSAVAKVLHRLAVAGYLERTPDDVWVPTRQFFARAFADAHVPAGAPATLSDVALDTLVMDDFLIGNPSRTVLVTVKGDSMIEAGIHSGDIVIVEKGVQARPGDIVVAIIDNEFTLKTLALERGKPILRPANPAFPVIRPRGTLEILGVVVGMARKYRR